MGSGVGLRQVIVKERKIVKYGPQNAPILRFPLLKGSSRLFSTLDRNFQKQLTQSLFDRGNLMPRLTRTTSHSLDTQDQFLYSPSKKKGFLANNSILVGVYER
jgi:hypothetical protein